MKKKDYLIIGSISAIVCEILYGLSYVFTKKIVEMVSALTLLGWRFVIGAIAISILVFFKIIKIQFNIKNCKELLLISLFNPILYFIGETLGISNTTALESGIFLACIPVTSLIASTLILKKEPSKIQVLGIVITLIGVFITVVAVNVSVNMSIIGYMFLLLAVISYSLYSVFVEKANAYTGIEITFFMIITGAFVFGIAAVIESISYGKVYELITLPFVNHSFLIAVLYQGIGCSIIAFFLSNFAIETIGVNRTSSFIGISTVVSILSGVLFLNENVIILQLIGAFIILIGVYIAN